MRTQCLTGDGVFDNARAEFRGGFGNRVQDRAPHRTIWCEIWERGSSFRFEIGCGTPSEQERDGVVVQGQHHETGFGTRGLGQGRGRQLMITCESCAPPIDLCSHNVGKKDGELHGVPLPGLCVVTFFCSTTCTQSAAEGTITHQENAAAGRSMETRNISEALRYSMLHIFAFSCVHRRQNPTKHSNVLNLWDIRSEVRTDSKFVGQKG